jgi:hypothetical protein
MRCSFPRRLTLALSGRALPVTSRRGRTMYQGARGAYAMTHHGPLERVVRRHPHRLQPTTALSRGPATPLPQLGLSIGADYTSEY